LSILFYRFSILIYCLFQTADELQSEIDELQSEIPNNLRARANGRQAKEYAFAKS